MSFLEQKQTHPNSYNHASCLPTQLHKVALRVSVLHPNSTHAPEDSETE